MLKQKDIITFEDDKEYVVVDTFNENNNTYIYLVNINNNSDVIFGKLVNDEVVDITDPIELEKVIKLVNEHLSNKKEQ